MDKEEMRAICDILNYIRKNPNIKNTAEGIAKYWIYQQRLEEKLEVVLAAIEYLVKEDFLQEVQSANGGRYFKVNERKVAAIPDMLTRLQQKKQDSEEA